MPEKQIVLPDIGDFEQVEVIEVLVAPGHTIEKNSSIITLESEKAAMEVPSPAAGTVKSVQVKLGDKVSQGDALILLETSTEKPQNQESELQPTTQTTHTMPTAAPPARDGEKFVRAGPVSRKLARQLGVDLKQVSGSGQRGRIDRKDIKNHVKQSLKGKLSSHLVSQYTLDDFAAFGPVERGELSSIQRVVADRLAQTWAGVPHVTQHDEADITELEKYRKKLAGKTPKVKLALSTFLVSALASLLKTHTQFNASLGNDGYLILKQYCHIGIAMNTDYGLVVPVIKDADQMGVTDIALAIRNLLDKARNRKLQTEDMSGGCMTISNLGGIGGRSFTPIINSPEVAILGVGRAYTAAVWDDKQNHFTPRLRLPLSLSYDHRCINGADAALFLTEYCTLLSQPKKMK